MRSFWQPNARAGFTPLTLTGMFFESTPAMYLAWRMADLLVPSVSSWPVKSA